MLGAEADVYWGRGWEGDDAPSLWPWAQVLAGMAERRGAAAIADAAGASACELIPIAPILGSLTDTAGARGDGQSRFRQGDALSRALSGLAQEQPMAVVIDDLHWADPASLALVRHLV